MPGRPIIATSTSILVLDEGTTSTRAVLFGSDGRALDSEARPLSIETKVSGAVEQDATEIYERSVDVLRTVAERAAAGGQGITALAMTAQRTTTVLWDRTTGEPVAPVYSWQDTRAIPMLDDLREQWAQAVTRTTGLQYASGSPFHLAWMLRDPELRRRAEAGELLAGTIETWLVWKFTGGPDGGVFRTPWSCAGSSGLYDSARDRWYEEFLSAVGVPVAMLPEVTAEDGDYGMARVASAGVELPITGVVGDQQSALYGHGGLAPGAVKCTHGTGSFVDFNAGPHNVATGYGLDCRTGWQTRAGRSYVLEGGTSVSGSGIDWLVEGLGVLERADLVDATYRAADRESGVLCVPALAGFAAPHWDGQARGLLVGLNRGTTKADVVRGTVDGIAHTVTDLVETMGRLAGVPVTTLLVDGGLSRSDTLLQAQADFLQVPVVRAADPEFVTARGAALIAGIATGVWDGEESALATAAEGRTFEPMMAETERRIRRGAWQDAVDRTLGWHTPAYR
ncbi:FGGY family carbohydrate kinase [Streptomyces sp. SID3343]|uniref:FGGY family carbohydrate kinase n=1 Tax=Streptomyces sp. SID3343 TaxID=2690260 RepID=UPI002351AE61|nr:FGGY family carbohydrate kinase [Streptomyces sp. SID3343]